MEQVTREARRIVGEAIGRQQALSECPRAEIAAFARGQASGLEIARLRDPQFEWYRTLLRNGVFPRTEAVP
jgi:hypothetical protein